MKAVFPLHSIETFTHSVHDNGIYVGDLSTHLRENNFITSRHKHDFYCLIICLNGSGVQEIDFVRYEARTTMAYFMYPGQEHRLISKSKDLQGYVVFHSRDFYEIGFNGRSIRDFPFYYCTLNSPQLGLKKPVCSELSIYCKELLNEYGKNEAGKQQKLCSLIDLIYITLSREYQKEYKSEHAAAFSPSRLRSFEELLEKNFQVMKSPAEYADMMKISTKQLNRLCRESVGKTTSDLILDRVVLEAKRELLHGQKNVSEIAAQLGYFDTGYFSRIFRKKTTLSPSEFVRAHEMK